MTRTIKSQSRQAHFARCEEWARHEHHDARACTFILNSIPPGRSTDGRGVTYYRDLSTGVVTRTGFRPVDAKRSERLVRKFNA